MSSGSPSKYVIRQTNPENVDLGCAPLRVAVLALACIYI